MFKTLLASILIAGVTLPAAAQVGPGLGSSDYVNRRNSNSNCPGRFEDSQLIFL